MGTPREIKAMAEEVPGNDPLPLSATLTDPPASLLVTVTVPVRAPVAAGAKLTLMVQAAPAASAAVQVLVSLKSPVIEMTILARVPVPVLLNEMLCATLVVPVAWAANISNCGFTVAMGCPAAVAVTDVDALPDPPAPVQINVYM